MKARRGQVEFDASRRIFEGEAAGLRRGGEQAQRDDVGLAHGSAEKTIDGPQFVSHVRVGFERFRGEQVMSGSALE